LCIFFQIPVETPFHEYVQPSLSSKPPTRQDELVMGTLLGFFMSKLFCAPGYQVPWVWVWVKWSEGMLKQENGKRQDPRSFCKETVVLVGSF